MSDRRHVLFVNSTQSGLHTIRRAVQRDFFVTLIRGMAVDDYAIDDDDFKALLLSLDQIVELPETFDTDALTDAIRQVHAARPVNAVISQYDTSLEEVTLACERIGLPFTEHAGAVNSRDKSRTRLALVEAGLASVRWSVTRDAGTAVRAANDIGYPVVVKPVSGADSILTRRAECPADVTAAMDAVHAAETRPDTPERVRRLLWRGVMVEQHIEGELVSAEIGIRSGRTWRFLVSGRARADVDDCVEMGAFLPAAIDTPTRDQCFDYAEAVCRALRLSTGIFHVEMILNARDAAPVLVEVNARAMGGVMSQLYRQLTGTDFCDHIIDLHLGDELTIPDVPPNRTVAARRIMPLADATLPARIDLAWLDDPTLGVLSFENFRFTPGAEVRRQDVLGRVAVAAADPTIAARRADDLVARFEEKLGISLFRSALPATNSR